MKQIIDTTRRVLAAGLLPVLTLALVASTAVAVPSLDTAYGTDIVWISAEINAMGATGVALDRGGFGTVFNPATLALAGDWRVDAGLSFAEEHEDRFQPLFDTFNSYVTDTAIASNRSHRFGTGFAASRSLSRDLGLGVSLTTRRAFGYDFNEQIRDPNPTPSNEDPRDRILEERFVEIDGNIQDLAVGLGWYVHDQLRLGASFHYLFGGPTWTLSQRDFLAPENSRFVESEWEANGATGTFGVFWTPDERLNLGASYELGYDITGDVLAKTTTGATGLPVAVENGFTMNYPERARVGFAYLPRSDPRTVFTAELAWSDGSTLANSLVEDPRRPEDVFDYRVGLEHTFYNGVPVRFGFRHLEHASDPEPTSTIFSAGIGMPFAEGMINVGTELGKVTSLQTHWFEYPEDYLVYGNARVEETLFRLGATFTYRF